MEDEAARIENGTVPFWESVAKAQAGNRQAVELSIAKIAELRNEVRRLRTLAQELRLLPSTRNPFDGHTFGGG